MEWAGVQAKVLEQAGDQTVAQLRRVVRTAVDRADADAAQRRHEERRALRAVHLCLKPPPKPPTAPNLEPRTPEPPKDPR
jgi:hypothetical protein